MVSMDCTTKTERLCHVHHHACSDLERCHGHHENAAEAFVSSWSSKKVTLQDSLWKLKCSTQLQGTRGLQWPCREHLHCQLGPVPFLKGSVNHLDNHHCARVEVANAVAYLAPFFHGLWMLCHNWVHNVRVLWIPSLHAKLQPKCCTAVDPTSHNLPPHSSPHALGPCLLARLVVQVSGRLY